MGSHYFPRMLIHSRTIGIFSSVLLLMVIVGCASTRPAPVIERASASKKTNPKPKSAVKEKEGDWRPATYVVQKGDTLYSIALEHGLDYKEISEWNNIGKGNVIRTGQQLKLMQSAKVIPVTPPRTAAEAKNAAPEGLVKTQPKALKVPYSEQAAIQPEAAAVAPVSNNHAVAAPEKPQLKVAEDKKERTQGEGDDEEVDWVWPVQGKLIGRFNDAGGVKGLDIAGQSGQAIFASAPGKVVYSGSGLRGYGKLIIIKHNKTYLSAYAHNSKILVNEGQNVLKGQKIAEMGDSDADQVKLHFEIRRLGKPVDPAKYLPGDKAL